MLAIVSCFAENTISDFCAITIDALAIAGKLISFHMPLETYRMQCTFVEFYLARSFGDPLD